MIKIFISPSCSSCRKVKEWFDIQKIPYETKNILSGSLTRDEIKEILSKSMDGTDEIISTRSNVIKDNKIDLNSLSLKELIDFIHDNPSCLKRPIIMDEKKIQVGYNAEEIRSFIPKEKRQLKYCTPGMCANYDICHKQANKFKKVNNLEQIENKEVTK
jgi:regulatory protein spx